MKTVLMFNPDCMRVSDVKKCALLLRDLVKRRDLLRERNAPEADMFLSAFDTLTQNFECDR
jgi:RNA polymerase-interacting CarD/CdnL/TRCF family regulator